MPARWIVCVPSLGAQLHARLGPKAEHMRLMLADLLAQQRHRFGIERHRDGLARFGLVGAYPRQLSRHIDLLPMQTGHIRCSQARRERECRHVRKMLGQLGQEPVSLLRASESECVGSAPAAYEPAGPDPATPTD